MNPHEDLTKPTTSRVRGTSKSSAFLVPPLSVVQKIMNSSDPDIFKNKESDQRYKDCLMSLGQAAVSFQQLESNIAELVGFLCAPEDYDAGEIITAELSFRGLCNLASSMFRHWGGFSDEEIKELESILSECFKLEGRRNQLIHSTYGMTGYWGEVGEFQRTKIRAKFKKGKEEICEILTQEDLSEFAIECTKSGCSIGDFKNKIQKDWSNG